jgi:GxxExxY protein
MALDQWAGLTDKILGAAIAVHRTLGPGHQEAIYHKGLVLELRSVGCHTSSEVEVPILYRGVLLGRHRLDLVVASKAVVELRAVSRFDAAHFAQVRSYLAASGLPVGLLITFSGAKVECRRVYPPQDRIAFSGPRDSRVPAPDQLGPSVVAGPMTPTPAAAP